MSGEIRNNWSIPVDAAPGTTLMGVGNFPPRRDITPLGTTVFVSPATVAAIAKAKRNSSPGELIEIHEDDFMEHDGADTLIDARGDNLAPEDHDGHNGRNGHAHGRGHGHGRRRHTGTELVRVDHNVALERTDRNRGLVRQKHDTELMERPETGVGKWQQFEDLGLAPRPITRKAQKLVVSTYRLLGFGILTIIVGVLLSYIATTSFYFVNKTWIAPVAISPNDEKVVMLKTQLATQMNERERLIAELDQSERRIKAEQAFQMQFAKAIKADAAGRRQALARVQSLASAAAGTRAQITKDTGDYSAAEQARMEKEYQGGLITRDSMMAGKFQRAQIQSAHLSLAERQAEFDQRAAELKSQTASLDALLANQSVGSALSYDVLKIARDYEQSKLELARETGNRDRLKTAIDRQQGIIEGLSGSAYLRALDNGATVALVPYDNLHNAAKGTPLYACRISMIWCRQVGEVMDILPGEVQLKHPKRDTMMRGRMIEMKMSEPEAAYKEVLFMGGKPLKF